MEQIPNSAPSLLGTLQLEVSMAAVAERGIRKRGPAAFVSAIQRIAVLTRKLEALADMYSRAESQLSLDLDEAELFQSQIGSAAES